MKKQVFIAMVAYLLLCPVAALSADDAFDFGEPGPVGKEERKAWSVSTGETYLPDSRVKGSDNGVEMFETRMRLGRGFTLTDSSMLRTGLSYAHKAINADGPLRLPNSLHTFSVNLTGLYKKDRASAGFMLSPALNGDFQGSIGSKDLRIASAIFLRYRTEQRVTLFGGIAYNAGYFETRVMPFFGLNYKPDEHWSIDFGFPSMSVSYRVDRTKVYASGSFRGGEYHIGDPSIGASRFRYGDRRLSAGIDHGFANGMGIDLETGYAFGRRFTFRDGLRPDIKVKDAPFAGISLSYKW